MNKQPPCRLLIIGGETKNLPLKQLYQAEKLGLIKWEHKNGLKKVKLSFGSGNIPTVALVFTDFLGHAAESKIIPRLKTLNIPIVRARGGFPSLLREAERMGHGYLMKVLGNRKDNNPDPKPKYKKVDLLPSKEAPFIYVATIDDRTFRVTKKKGVLTLIVRDSLLDETEEYAQSHHLGKGKRGGIRMGEAQDLVEYLEAKYGFFRYGIRINPASVQRNVNLIRGALTPKAAAMATRRGRKAVAKKKSEKREKLSKEIGALSPEEGKIKGSAIEIFLAEIAGTMKILVTFPDKYEKLFSRILDLEETNRLLGDENEVLKKDLTFMKTDRDKWKRVATEEG